MCRSVLQTQGFGCPSSCDIVVLLQELLSANCDCPVKAGVSMFNGRACATTCLSVKS